MIDQLIDSIVAKENSTVAGLDTRLEYLPEFLLKKYSACECEFEGAANAIFEFNKGIIDAIHDLIPAVKVQVAYYESYGVAGLQAFKNTLDYATNKGLLTIADVKRNDIGPTAEAYSSAFLGETQLFTGKKRAFESDFVTVNPYLGSDGINPFLKDCEKFNKGIFILVKTSNPSSGEIQDVQTEEGKIYELVGKKVDFWGSKVIGRHGYSSVGAVVGATYPQQLEDLRKLMPNSYILLPGYGAQGAKGSDIVPGFSENGLGAIINASRSIICAWKNDPKNPEGFAQAARDEVVRMKDEIDAALKLARKCAW